MSTLDHSDYSVYLVRKVRLPFDLNPQVWGDIGQFAVAAGVRLTILDKGTILSIKATTTSPIDAFLSNLDSYFRIHCESDSAHPNPQNPKPLSADTEAPPQAGFPRFWEVFPVILPRAVRERVYEPYHEELKEDYLRHRARWRTKWAKRYVTFAFTMRTAGAVGVSLWAAVGGAVRKAILAALTIVAGAGAVEWARGWLAGLWGRLP